MRLKIAIAVVGLGAAAAAAAAGPSMPARRAGLWETTLSTAGMPARGMKTRVCADPARERGAAAFSGPFGASPPGVKGAPACTQRDVHPVAGGWAFHSVCTSPRGASEMSGVLTGDFQSHYHLAMDVRAGGQAHHMTIDARWLGPCRPGTPPAIVLPDGKVMTMPGPA